MLEDVRSQMYQSKATQEAEMSRLESRLTLKIDDSVRNNEKFVSSIYVYFTLWIKSLFL